MLLNLNAVMSIIANVPAAVASTVRTKFLSAVPGSFWTYPSPPPPSPPNPDRGLPRRAEINEVHDGQQRRVFRVRSFRLATRIARTTSSMCSLCASVCCSTTRASTLAFTRSSRFTGGTLSAGENLNLKKIEGVHVQVRSFSF